ncbi:hypothetical protein STCU_10388 [Strigomonas culicis]|uniref:Uncharacterized protein n=1 Tax=Strigomonas culicis TaxID=28005 RepID=S9TN57_9TRYP|nr:hypothetical protein STCU_10388 [Strigomonas culicis]|eukprot:EPY17818.1 hypothetical protein STCU_10388 [Strigomonas culicis]
MVVRLHSTTQTMPRTTVVRGPQPTSCEITRTREGRRLPPPVGPDPHKRMTTTHQSDAWVHPLIFFVDVQSPEGGVGGAGGPGGHYQRAPNSRGRSQKDVKEKKKRLKEEAKKKKELLKELEKQERARLKMDESSTKTGSTMGEAKNKKGFVDKLRNIFK